MEPIKTLLAVEPRILCDLLQTVIEAQCDMKVVGVAHNPIDLLLAVKNTEAHVVVMSVSEPDGVPAICTHLLTEFPDLLVIGLPPQTDHALTFWSEVKSEQRASIEEVLAAMRAVQY